MTRFALLVGQWFNKPSPTLLRCLPDGAGVTLRGDPDNPYDSEAIKVVLESPHLALSPSKLDDPSVAEELLAAGWTLGDLLLQSEFLLGHVAASGRKPLEKAMPSAPGAVVGTKELPEGTRPPFGKLRFLGELVWIELEGA